MDERIVFEGERLSVPVVFYDDNLNSLDWWKEKHRGYAKREAQQAIESLKSGVWTDPRKAKYYKLPSYFRAVAYFCIRYFLKLGFLDGVAGFRWHFWQGLWYRWIVDRVLARLSTFETKVSVLRGLLSAFLNYQIKVFTTPLRMPFAPLPS